MSNSIIIAYTDGSCIKKSIKDSQGAGGWALCILQTNSDFIISGGEKSTTNNRMELTAVIETLKFLKSRKRIKIISDSKYVINCAKGEWKRNKNKDLWELYDLYSKNKELEFEWVKGHSKDYYNDLVDNFAQTEARKFLSI